MFRSIGLEQYFIGWKRREFRLPPSAHKGKLADGITIAECARELRARDRLISCSEIDEADTLIKAPCMNDRRLHEFMLLRFAPALLIGSVALFVLLLLWTP